MKRGLFDIPVEEWPAMVDPGPDPRDPDPDAGPEVEAADPFWLPGCNNVHRTQTKNHEKSILSNRKLKKVERAVEKTVIVIYFCSATCDEISYP